MDTFKDMYKVYSKTPTVDLIKNRNRKARELSKLANEFSYWAKKDKARLTHMITQIEAVIEARAAQMPLL